MLSIKTTNNIQTSTPTVITVESVPMAMPDRDQPIDRDIEKPPPEESGTGDEPGSVWLDRLLRRLPNSAATNNENDRPHQPIDESSDRKPPKPAPEESGVWNKRGSRTIDRIVEWLVPPRSKD